MCRASMILNKEKSLEPKGHLVILALYIYMIQQKIHTGCHCKQCRRGKDKITRGIFHRMMRRFYKKQLQTEGEILAVNKSIGYTD